MAAGGGPQASAAAETPAAAAAAPSGLSARYRRFTPAEAAIDRGLCLARTWADGRGGQCQRFPASGSLFCKMHLLGGPGQEQWRVHGHVDGPIPEDMYRKFEMNADNRGGDKVDLSAWKKRRLVSREDAMDMDPRMLVNFTKDSGYSGEKWKIIRERLLNNTGDKAKAVETLLQEQASDLWTEVMRIQRSEGEARARLLQ
mmetsp:Transcript_118598/g.295779  ORF Transcript_118598/g.295779 Transcript_118598/m.295779 type:complete len:200 (-) Transcript_118598:104-703(-)